MGMRRGWGDGGKEELLFPHLPTSPSPSSLSSPHLPISPSPHLPISPQPSSFSQSGQFSSS
ncbi:MAG: hypothetical protein RMY29_000945 [Nostoc sp. CreGUA01]